MLAGLALLLLGGSNTWSLLQQYRYVEQEEGDRLQVAAHWLADLMVRRLPAEDFHALMASVRYAPDVRVSVQVDGERFEAWGAAGSDGEGAHWMIEGERGAASILKMNPSTLRSRMQKLGIRRPPR